MNIKNKFGLIGKNIAYSFSKKYFTQKFKKLHISNAEYVNFDLPSVNDFLKIDINNVKGFNVTIPYKKQIIPFLTGMSKEAQKIGAVNTIKVTKKGLFGYNTDVYGFQKSIEPLLQKHHKKALILGTGGASQAVAYVFDKCGVSYAFVSRTKTSSTITYFDITEELLQNYTVIVNCTPVGTYPNIDKMPDIPYQYITKKHLLYDLIYNPEETKFLEKGRKRGAITKNGYEMLVLQAEKSWKIWDN